MAVNDPNKQLNLKTTALHHAIQNKVQKLYGDFGQACIHAGFNGIKDKKFDDLRQYDVI